MAEAIAAKYRAVERVEKDEFIDVTLSPEQAAAILALLRHAGGTGRIAKLLGPVFTGLATIEASTPDIPYAVTHTFASDGRPLVHFDDPPPEVPSYDPPAGAGG